MTTSASPRARVGAGLLMFLGTACAGAATPHPDDASLLPALIASQQEPYALPATAEDMSFTVHASLASVAWQGLRPEQLLDWAHAWQVSREAEDRPSVPFEWREEDGTEGHRNLFDRSARDGFCVVMAQSLDDREPANTALRAAWRRVSADL